MRGVAEWLGRHRYWLATCPVLALVFERLPSAGRAVVVAVLLVVVWFPAAYRTGRAPWHSGSAFRDGLGGRN